MVWEYEGVGDVDVRCGDVDARVWGYEGAEGVVWVWD